MNPRHDTQGGSPHHFPLSPASPVRPDRSDQGFPPVYAVPFLYRLRPARRSHGGGRFLPAVLFALLAAASADARAREYWIAPPGSGNCSSSWNNNSPSNPLCFDTVTVQQIIANNPLAPSDPEVRLTFFSGTYETDALFLNGGPNRSLILRAEDPANPPVLRFKVPGAAYGHFRGPSRETWLLHGSETLARFEAHDLILDGNWPAWAATDTHASPANTAGFKLGALRAKAVTGWVRKVRVLNCGANGITPWPWWGGAGTESFPLWVEAAAYQPNAWVIEECEVRDFYSVHGGYCTAIMVTVEKPGSSPDPADRVVEVRRCQVYGSNLEVGLGTAHSTGISFHDNVVVGVDRGFSCDTVNERGILRNVDLTNNVFLDVNLLANIGGPVWGGAGGSWSFTNFVVAGNAVRLESVPLYQNYRSYEWQAVTYGSFTNWMPVSSATLAAGRWATGFCAGLLVGGADQIRFQTNRFTTRPLGGFFEPDPTNTARARWRPFWAPAYSPVTGQICYHGTYPVTNILISAHAMDFTNSATLADPTAEQYALEQLPLANFIPAGRVERVVSFYDGAGRLSDVWEIQVTRPEVVGGEVRVRARSVAHRPHADTAVWYPASLVLDVRAGPNTQVVGVNAIWTNDVAYFSYPTNGAGGRDEIVVRTVGAPDQIARTVVEYFHGQTVRFERMADVADDRRLNPGAFRISRSNPTGDLDVWVEAVTPGQLRFAVPGSSGDYYLYTNHVTATNSWYYLPPEGNGQWKVRLPAGKAEALVRVVPVNTATNRHWIEDEMAAFQLVSNAAYVLAPPGPWTTPGPAAHTVAVTLWDGPRYWMYDLTATWYFDCGGSSSGALDFAGAESPPMLTDHETGEPFEFPEETGSAAEETGAGRLPAGPWVYTRTGELIPVEVDAPPAGAAVEEIPGELLAEAAPDQGALDGSTCYLSGWGNTAYGINSLASPVIAGSAFFNNSGYPQLPQPYFQVGGSWLWPGTWNFRPVGDAWSGGLMRDVDSGNNLVGTLNHRACYVPAATGMPVFLPGLSTNSPPGAYAISDNAYAVGWARANGLDRAVLWDLLDTPITVLDLDTNNPTRSGYAYGVNSRGVTVGKVQRVKDNVTVWRAFRWQSGELTELVLPAAPNGVGLSNNVANDLSASGHAIGATDTEVFRGYYTNQTRACVWWAGTTAPVLLGTVGWTDPDASYQPGRSEALGAVELSTNRLVVVGTGWITPTGCSRAYRQVVFRDEEGRTLQNDALNLNDPQLAVVPSGWTLLTAEDVNSNEWIVGLATDSPGQSRGYVLVPQQPVSP